ERTSLNQEKTGVFTGSFVLHPITNEKIPVWIADYVLSTYGTGAVMAVPAHDECDFAFAQKYKLPVKVVVSAPAFSSHQPTAEATPYTELGVLTNSGEHTGMPSAKAMNVVTKAAKGKKAVTYRMR